MESQIYSFPHTCKKQITLSFDPFHPNVSMHILHTVLYTFLEGADKENMFHNQKLFNLVILYSRNLNVWIKADIIRRN